MAASRTASRKPAASKVRSISDTPAKIAINLDALERENPSEPFVAVMAGRQLHFIDPTEVPWQDLQNLDDPELFAETTLPADEREHFLLTPTPAWKMNELIRAYQQHFGLGDQGNARA